MNKHLAILSLFLLLTPPPPVSADQSALDSYITRGLQGNLAVRQENLSLEKSLEALKEAKGLFFPNVSVQARYSRAGGGRMIEIPIGDLTNPLYQSLNQLYGFHGIVSGFPTDLPNEVFPFLRRSEQETKLRLIQPLYQPALVHNLRLQKSLNKTTEAKLAVLKRQLVADIKSAYFTHLKSLEMEKLLEQTRDLLEENLRVSRALFDNGKATEDIIFRSEAEIADLEQKISEAKKNTLVSSGYFNFLLNRDLGEGINTDFEASVDPGAFDFETAARSALRHRDEFLALRSALQATGSQVNLAGSGALPSLSLVVDLGIQGEKYAFGPDDDFWMASLIFQWTLYDGRQTRAKKAQAVIEKRRLEMQLSALETQILLQVKDAFHSLNAAGEAVQAAEKRVKSSAESYAIVERKYGYGSASQIEYIDARTAFTNASISAILARYDYLISRASLERAAALINLEDYQ